MVIFWGKLWLFHSSLTWQPWSVSLLTLVEKVQKVGQLRIDVVADDSVMPDVDSQKQDFEEVVVEGTIGDEKPQVAAGGEAKMSLLSSAKIHLASPVLREWLAQRKSNIRPVGTFFNTGNFQVPPSAGRLTKRVPKNLEYFQSNYVLLFLVLVLYCLITSPLLLIVIGAVAGGCYFVSIKNQENKLSIAGHEISVAGQYALIVVLSIPFLLLAGAGGIVFWVIGASMFTIGLHATFYNYDALDVPEDQEQLIGQIVEEV